MPSMPRGPEPASGRAPRPERPHAETREVRIVTTGSIRTRVWLLAGAVLLTAAALIAAGRLVIEKMPSVPPPDRAVAASPIPRRVAQVPELRASPRPARPVPAPEPAAPAPPAPDLDPDAPTYTVDPPGSPPSGIGLFPSPGTDPPKRGIIVPDDADLPEGYVRHYQATDDGKALPPILLFHPDYEWVDEQGAVVGLPQSRVVPPEMAPPGIPIQILEIPEPDDDAP